MSKTKPNEKISTDDFTKGDPVRYVPEHAKGDPTHEDCEDGVVSSVDDNHVFVKYFRMQPNGIIWPPIFTGEEPYTAQATKPDNLQLRLKGGTSE